MWKDLLGMLWNAKMKASYRIQMKASYWIQCANLVSWTHVITIIIIILLHREKSCEAHFMENNRIRKMNVSFKNAIKTHNQHLINKHFLLAGFWKLRKCETNALFTSTQFVSLSFQREKASTYRPFLWFSRFHCLKQLITCQRNWA